MWEWFTDIYQNGGAEMKKNKGRDFFVGWGQADITPDKPVILGGQFYARVSEGIMDPVTATALVVESREGGISDYAVMVSYDLVGVSNELRDAVHRRIKEKIPAFDTNRVFLGATHTHSAPDMRMTPYGMNTISADYRYSLTGKLESQKEKAYGMWPYLDIDGLMPPAEYIEFAAERVARAVSEAWENRESSGIAYGLGHAVIGRNRRISFKDGTSVMYGKADKPEFSHVEGYEDHSVYAMMTYDINSKLTGIIINIACPSQIDEQIYMISADFWHETREELRRKFGKDIYIMPQCAPAGEQSPRVLVGRRAEVRMWHLKGLKNKDKYDGNPPRKEIALKISNTISEIMPYVEKEIDWNPEFRYRQEIVNLPRRMISEDDVKKALADALPYKEQYRKIAEEIEKNPEIRKDLKRRSEITRAYRFMERGERVKMRFELQKEYPDMPVDLHVLRVGETAFATNPFELYLDYAVRIREWSKATQTFLIQKAGCSGTYLPSRRSISYGGYGSAPASTDIGPDGGDKLVEWTVSAINEMFD